MAGIRTENIRIERGMIMDLGAYAQIEELDQVMKDNGISVPRLRGLRLMVEEKPLTKEE